ncbi:MAG: Asp-tRNA(Asn)/Glu-tRNA(Gln) amidotransferase subunit GatA [Candidatus Pacebacteria bacterium]|nr:Asp-tRNA(Asn)/Glu-tRNA(Gln) amidotransferase subunit GatA [Candidatus Paceibacterota bacterium]
MSDTITDLIAAYKAGTTTPRAEVERVFRTIADRPSINAFLETYEAEALAAADSATARYAAHDTTVPPLLGVPVAVKNNILVAGKKATAASKILENYIAVYDATIVTRLREAGAIIVGATNMDEFAMGGSTENSAFGVTRNPLDETRVPGGSSGGSAAAVAMRAVPVALGTDTGGSIRQPASYCGLVGLKPTYGAVSRYGLIAMGSSLDQAGPLTHTVADAELVHQLIAGHDPMDATTITADTYEAVPVKTNYRIGVPRSFMASGVDADVLATFETHLAALQAAGHTIVDIELPLFEQGLSAYYIVMPAEVSSNTARYDGIRYGLSMPGKNLLEVYEATRGAGFGAEVKRRILLGTYVLSSGYYDAYYGKAEVVRAQMRQELATQFADVDLIVTPTAPTPAFTLGEQTDPLSMYRQDIFTVPVNLTGVPALSFPMGTVERGSVALPVGVQYIAPHGGEARLFDIGKRTYDATK